MSRADLLALTRDDLAAFTNLGTVKRAQRELESGSPTCRIEETATGELTVTWSDGISCRFPAGKTLHDAVCSSGIAGISRHVVRSVLAYQQQSSPATGTAAEAAEEARPDVLEPPVPAVWDPGAFSDDDLAARFRPAAVARARQRFERGVLVELTRGQKPLARFLDEPCTLRFLVAGDLRYVTADCAETLLATYVPLAVWAFRALPADRAAGLVAIQKIEWPTPTDVLDEIQSRLAELATEGLAAGPAARPQQWARLEEKARQSGLVWPAELLADLLHQCQQYAAHDARFDPQEVTHLVGELLARQRAIAGRTSTVPQVLIRGSTGDRVTDIAGGRLIGLGLGVRPGRRLTTLNAFLQDVDTGSVVAVERTFADPEEGSQEVPKSYADLAGVSLMRGITLGGLAASQVLLKSGKRTPSGRLVLPRMAGTMTVNPQAFAWEQLKPPAAVESVAQLAALIESRPPSCLGPRRLTDQLYVCPVAGASDARFDVAGQRLLAVLRDHRGDEMLLVHPYHYRAREGFEGLAAALETGPDRVRFVCGQVALAGRRPVIRPINVVLEEDGRRTGILPWIAPPPAHSAASASHSGESGATGESSGPLESYVEQLRFELSELLLTGVRRSDLRTARVWNELAAQSRRLGFVRLAEPIEQLQHRLADKAEQAAWDPVPAARALLELCLDCRVLADIAP